MNKLMLIYSIDLGTIKYNEIHWNIRYNEIH